MSGPELDALLTHEDTPWRPSMAFFADLSERLDEVDAEIEAEREHIPQEGARADDSVLFSLDALRSQRGSGSRGRAAGEPSGVIDLARLASPPPEAVDSGPLAVGQDPALARRRRNGMWLAAAGFLLAAGGALAMGSAEEPVSPQVAIDTAPASSRTAPAALSHPTAPTTPRVAPSTPLRGVEGASGPASAAVLDEAPSALRACLSGAGAPARARIVWLADRPVVSGADGVTLTDSIRRCLLDAARALTPRAAPLVVTAP